MTWPNPGIYPEISNSDYFGLTEIGGKLVRSNSMLKQFDQDPALFKLGIGKKPTDSMRKGSIFDCLLTSPHRFEQDFVVSPYASFQKKEAQEWRDSQEKIIVKPQELEDAVSRIEKIQSDYRWQEITAGRPQFQLALRADLMDAPFKCLIDVLPDGADSPYWDAIVDVKFMGQMDTLDAVLKECRKFRYHDQGAMYRGMAKVLGMQRTRFILFIVPSSGPSTPCVLSLSSKMLDLGGDSIRRKHLRLLECETTGRWPGRFEGVKDIDAGDDNWPWTEKEEDLEEAS